MTPEVLDEASVQPNPRVYGVCLARRTLGDRELRALFGGKGLPEFLGLGPHAVVPTYEELLARAGRRL